MIMLWSNFFLFDRLLFGFPDIVLPVVANIDIVAQAKVVKEGKSWLMLHRRQIDQTNGGKRTVKKKSEQKGDM
jgi:hypothetical protein